MQPWRSLVLPVAIVMILSGCLGGGNRSEGSGDLLACGEEEPREFVYYFSAGHALVGSGEPPDAGFVPGNGFVEAFLTDEANEWLSAPLAEGLILEGRVTLEFWARNVGTPAPIVIGGAPGEGYHFFNQFGSNRTFQPAYTVEYGALAPEPGSVDHYSRELQLPPGGVVVEAGDRLRVLLTSLVLDDENGSGHDILFGGDTPSRVVFQARCYPTLDWEMVDHQSFPVSMVANQGLLTGAVPPSEGVNTATIPLVLDGATERLTIRLQQTSDPNPVKDDMDLVVEDEAGHVVWSIGTPYSNESGTLWRGNLEAMMPPGHYVVRVNSYSGMAYEGLVEVHQERGVEPSSQPSDP